MGQQRLNNLIVLHVHKDLTDTIDLQKIATEFTGDSEHRFKIFGKPISVGGPFERLGIDVLQLPRLSHGNRYAIVFMDYLTKWPKVFPAADQSAPTITKLLVEEVISQHGVPCELLSDRGAAFMSKLWQKFALLWASKGKYHCVPPINRRTHGTL